MPLKFSLQFITDEKVFDISIELATCTHADITVKD